MKNIKLISILLVLTLALTSFSFFVNADNSEGEDIVIESFDGNTSVINGTSREHASISEDFAESGTKSLKLSTVGMTLAEETEAIKYYWMAEINPTNKNSGNAEYMRFWVKNTTGKQLRLDFVPSNGTRLNTSNAPYYFENSAGDVWTKNAFSNAEYGGRGAMLIPSDFTGYVYVPKTSYIDFYVNDKMRISTDVRNLQTGALYIDSISFTDNLPALNLHVNFDTASDYTATLPEGVIVTDEYFYSAGKSLKFDSEQYVLADNSKGYRSVKLQAFSLINSDGLGLKFWVNNTAENEVYLTAGLAANNGFTKQVACYLENAFGDTVQVSSADAGYYGYRAVRLPSKFEGWLYIPFTAFANGSSDFNELRFFVRQDDLKTGALYIDSIQKFFESPTPNLLENFDYSTVFVDKTDAGFATISKDYSNSGENSLKLTSKDVTYDSDSSYWSVDITPSYKPAAGQGIRLWLKNTTGNNIKFDIAPNNYTALKTGSISYLTKDGKSFFLSRAKQNTDNWNRGVIIIPAEFEGFVYIPLASFKDTYSLSNFRIQLDKTELENGAFYVDSISYYSGYEHNVAKGDCNYDGAVDIRDLVKLKKYIAGTDLYADFDAADVDTDYKINANDISALRKMLLAS